MSASGSDSVTVSPQPLVVVVTCQSSNATAGKPFDCEVAATGGTSPYSGIGIFEVTEPVKGTYAVSFDVTDANQVTAFGSSSVTVAPQPLVVAVTCPSSGATAGKPFSCNVSATGGTAPYAGVGIFSVTTPVKGTFTETFTVTDANGASAIGSASVTIIPQPVVVTVYCPTTGLTAGKPFDCDVSATGGTEPYTGTGSFTITQPIKGTFTESFSVTDANQVTASGSATVTIAPQPLIVAVTCPGSGLTAGKPFSCTIYAAGGTAPYSGTGNFSRVEPVKGTFTESFNVTDANGISAIGYRTVIIAPQPLVVSVSCASGITAGKPFSCTVSATGGTTPYSGTGTFSLTEPVKGAFAETFTVTDANGVSASGSTSVSAAPQPLVATVVCPSSGITAGKPFTCSTSASGGTAPYAGTGDFTVTEPVKGTFTERFTVTEANGVTVTASTTVDVSPQPLVAIVACPTSSLTAGKPFSCSVSATGGTSPYQNIGTFQVTEPVKGAHLESFNVRDANGVSATATTTVMIAPQPLVVIVSCPSSGITAAKPFSCTVSATGGTQPYSGTGMFSVTEPVKGTFVEEFTVTDANHVSAVRSASVTIVPQPLVVTVSCQSGATAGKPFNCTVSATAGTEPYNGIGSFSITQPVKGTFTETFSVTDANQFSASGSATVTIAPQPLVVTVTCDTGQTAGKPFNCIVSATGGTSPYSGTGTFSVTEPVKGIYTEGFSVIDANGVGATGSASVIVEPQPLVDTVTCGSAFSTITAGKRFNCTVSATGGTAPYTGTGVFSVTEAVKGSFTEEFSVTDSNGIIATGSASIVVAPQPLVVSVDCGSGQTTGKPFSCAVSATGGTSPYLGTGVFSITESVKGIYSEEFAVVDSNGMVAAGAVIVTVAPQPLIVTVTCPTSGLTAGKPFNCTISATGGTSPYSGTGSMTLVESLKGAFTESFRVTDANGATASGSTSVIVVPQPLIVTVTCPASGLTAGKPFSCHVSASGGTQPYSGTGDFITTHAVKGSFIESFIVGDANAALATGSTTAVVSAQPLVVAVTCAPAITAGKPFDCTVSATGGTAPYSGVGIFSVSEPVKGTFPESFSVTDVNGAAASGSVAVTVAPQPLIVTVTCASPITAGKPIACLVSATGGTSPYSGTGIFTIAEPVKGTYVESFRVTDANGASATGLEGVIVNPQPLVPTLVCPVSGVTAGKPFTCTVSASGGTSPYFGTGAFTIMLSVKGTYTETFAVEDANGAIASVSATVTVAPQPLVVAVSCQSAPTSGKPFSFIVSATGGTAPYNGIGPFTVTEAVKGTFTESFQVTDVNNVSVIGSATVTIAPQPLAVIVVCPASAVTAGKPFNCTVSANGGTAPYQGTGVFRLTQPVKGTFSVSFNVTDANGLTAIGSTVFTVAPQPLVVNVTCPNSGLVAGKPFSCAVQATGGTGPYSGIGNFTITMPVKGTFTESLSATDANGLTTTGSASVVIAAQPMTVNFSFSGTLYSGSLTTFTATVSGGTSPYAYSWNFGDSSTIGTINPVAHTYLAAGNYSVLLTATDANGASFNATQTISIKVQDSTPPVIVSIITPGPNLYGWNNGNVTVSWSVTDPESGIIYTSGCVTIALSSNTAGTSFACTATNGVGLTSSSTVTVKIDMTRPTITGYRTPGPNSYGWNNDKVTVYFACSDNLSGIAVPPNSPQPVSNEGFNQSRTASCIDKAGNISSLRIGNINIDKTAPTVTGSASPAPDSFGWNNSTVTVTFTCYDSLSGVGSVTGPVALSSEGQHQSVKGTCLDKAGNQANANVANINIDKTPPTTTITFGKPSSGSNPTIVTSSTPISLSATDVLSGVYQIKYGIDNPSTSLVYSKSFTIPALGTHVIYFRSIDQALNVERVRSVKVTIQARLLVIDVPLVSVVSLAVTGLIVNFASYLKQADPRTAFFNNAFDLAREDIVELRKTR